MTENESAREIVDVAFKVHVLYGPGLLESVYETIMAYELRKRGFDVVQQRPLPVIHEAVRMNIGFRADLVIDNKVIIEVKSTERVAPVHKMQLLTYLRVADLRLGLLINFGEELIKDRISRVVNRLEE
jgi:GxxExxY protein